MKPASKKGSSGNTMLSPSRSLSRVRKAQKKVEGRGNGKGGAQGLGKLGQGLGPNMPLSFWLPIA